MWPPSNAHRLWWPGSHALYAFARHPSLWRESLGRPLVRHSPSDCLLLRHSQPEPIPAPLYWKPCAKPLAFLLLVRKTQRQQDLREMSGSTGFFAGSSTVSVDVLCPRGAGFCPRWLAQALDRTLSSRRTSENTLAFTAPEPGLH